MEELIKLYLECYTPPSEEKATLSERFLLPPFTVLDARQGYWQTRKRAWLSIGIKSELGRGDAVTWGITPSGEGTGDNVSATYTDNAKKRVHNAAPPGAALPLVKGKNGYEARKPNATPGGSPLPAASLKDGKTQRGDGRGRPLATTFGSGGPGTLAAVFKRDDTPRNTKANALPSGGGGGGWKEMNEKMAANRAKLQADNRAIKDHAWLAAHGLGIPQAGIEVQDEAQTTGTSIFDPVICELAYRWFTPVGGRVLDPFAGGSVRGIVAARLQRKYVGIDLREEQIAANEQQRQELCPDTDLQWITGDSIDVATLAPGKYDFVFSCHPESVRVLTEDRGQISIKDVVLGEMVVTHTGELKEVIELLSFRYTGFMYEILRDYRSYPLLATENHPILVKRVTLPPNGVCKCGCGDKINPDTNFLRGHNNKGHSGLWGGTHGYGQSTETRVKERSTSQTMWVRADEVKIGDYLLEPVPTQPKDVVDGRTIWENVDGVRAGMCGVGLRGSKTLAASKDLCRLVGYYLAGGWTGTGGVTFAFHEDETEYHDDIKRMWASLFSPDLGVRVRPVKNNKAVMVICNGTVASKFFSFENGGGGLGAASKRVPNWVWGCSDELIAEVIKGAWRGDGWACGERFGYASVSEQLVEDLRRLLLRLGVLCSVRVRHRKTGYGKTWKPQWYLSVKSSFADKMASILGEKIKTPPKRRRRGAYIENGVAYYPVRRVTRQAIHDYPVYNLEVKDNHSYLADGVSSHNCPPYADLERYSDDPRDISTMDYSDFLTTYRTIIAESCKLLNNNRFACFIVGLMRDKRGMYRDFVSDTIAAFRDAGLELYNDAVLVTSVGSLPIRVGKQFTSSRKLGRTHQNVLVFIKGDPVLAVEACGPVDMSDVALPDVPATECIGIVADDLMDVEGIDLLEGRVETDESDLVRFTCGTIEACLVCDILRCLARKSNMQQPRIWTTATGRWEQVAGNVDLVYAVGNTVYLNSAVFPTAASPKATAPPVRLLGRKTL